MQQSILYISDGRLFEWQSGAGEKQLVSPFVDDLKRRLKSVEDRASFRGGGGGSMFMRGGLPEGAPVSIEDTFYAEYSALAPLPESGHVCYAIDAHNVRGLFIRDLSEDYERRVLHGPKFRFTSISPRQGADGAEWLIAAAQDHGESRIGYFKPDAGGGIREMTEGDSIDSYPSWKPGKGRICVYQTCGVARRQGNNQMAGLGPASLVEVDLETGEMRTIEESDHFDFLCPAFGPDGTLYYLKRPYEPIHRPSPWQILQDILLFPFRLLRAIFAFLNVFSMLFSGKPLKTAGQAPQRNGPDPKAVFLYGRWVNMEKQVRDAAVNEMTSVIPKNWELVARRTDGSTATISTGVMSFTMAPDGALVYSNGRGIYTIKDGGKPVQLVSKSLVTSIAVVSKPEPAANT